MNQVRLPLSQIESVVIVCAGLGLGAGLLASDLMTFGQRRAIGWTLVALGGLSTFPLRVDVMRRRSNPLSCDEPSLTAIVRH